MHTFDTNIAFDHVILTRELPTPGDRSDFFVRARRGEFVALSRGVYVRSDEWVAMDRHGQYRRRVEAAAASRGPGMVFSHESAAALWRLPAVGAWPVRAHVVEPLAAGGRTNEMLVRHTVGMPELTEMIDGLHVTSLARTVVDIGSARPFTHAVAMADAALRRSLHPLRGVPPTALSRELLAGELDRLPLRHGSVKARRVVEFADGLADRPGESVSRVNMHRAALSAPQLQVVLTGHSGRRYVVDFWWPQFNVIGEFDGRAKYTDPEFLRGRTPEQALLDEKSREDDLRAAGHSVSRWGWDVAINPRLLRAHLVAAGVR